MGYKWDCFRETTENYGIRVAFHQWVNYWDRWVGRKDGTPSMFTKHLLRLGEWRVDLHKIVSHDDFLWYHSHPSYCLRIVLWGGYSEERPDWSRRTVPPGFFSIVSPGYFHRISGLLGAGPSYSLWIRGPRIAEVQIVTQRLSPEDRFHG